MNPELDGALVSLSELYLNRFVVDIFQVPGTFVVIKIGSEEEILLTVTILMAYWVLGNDYEEDAILTSYEDWTHQGKYKKCLNLLNAKKLKKIWFDEDELVLSFSDGYYFQIIEEPDYCDSDAVVVQFHEEGSLTALVYSPAKGWHRVLWNEEGV